MAEYDVDVLVQLGVDEKQAKKLRAELDNVEANITAVGESIRASFEGESAAAVEGAMERFKKAAENTRQLADAQSYAQQQIMALQSTQNNASSEAAQNQDEEARAIYNTNVAIAQQQQAVLQAANAQAQYNRVFESSPFVSGLGDVRRFENQLESVESQWDAIADAAKKANEVQEEATGGGGSSPSSSSDGGLTIAQKAGAGIRIVADGLDRFTDISPPAANAIRAVSVAVSTANVAAIAAVVGIGAVTAAFSALSEQSRKNAENYNRAADATRELNQEIEKGITSTELEQRRQDVLTQQRAEEQTLRQLQATYDAYIEQKGVLAGAVQAVSHEEEALAEQIRISQKAVQDYDQDLQGLEGAMQSSRVAANDAAAEFEKLNDEMERLANTNDNLLIAGLNTLDAAFGKTAEQIQDEIDGIERRRELIIQLLDSQQLSAEATQKLRDELGLLNGEMILLTDNVLPLAQATDAANAALEDRKRQEDEAVAATRKFNEGVAKLAQDSANERLKIEDDYAKKIIDLTRKYNEDLEDANIELGRDLADMIRDAGRDTDDAERQARQDRLQETIQFNNETAKQARDLQRELIKIREDSADQEEELIRNRDFAGLRNLRRERNRALDDAVDSFNAEQREREIAFREQQELTNQQLKFEAETRRIRFEQQVADARIAYNRDLDDLKRNRRRQEQVLADSRLRELTLVASTQNNKLSLLAQSYQTELRLAAQTAQQRLAIEQQVQSALLAQAQAFRAAFNLTGGNAGGNTITQTFQQTFSGGGSVQQNTALAGVIAVEVGRQIKNLLG